MSERGERSCGEIYRYFFISNFNILLLESKVIGIKHNSTLHCHQLTISEYPFANDFDFICILYLNAKEVQHF